MFLYMRKLIIKLFGGNYIFPTNLCLSLSGILSFVTLAALLHNVNLTSISILVINILLLFFGVKKLFWGKNNSRGTILRVVTVLFPLFYTAGLLWSLYDKEYLLVVIVLLSLFGVIYIGTEVYFSIKKFKYNELDDMNKYCLVEAGLYTPNADEFENYIKIVEKFNKIWTKYKIN